jgi:hypothetical protein
MARDERLVELLLKAGARVNAPVGSEGCTTLKLMEIVRYHAGPMELRRQRIVRLLKRSGASIRPDAPGAGGPK